MEKRFPLKDVLWIINSLAPQCVTAEDQGAIGNVSSRTKQDKTHADIKIQPPFLALIHVALGFVLTWINAKS